MKRFLKRMNRGVALGIILVLVLVVYIISDTVGFKKIKPELCDLATSYVSDYAQAGITPEAFRTVDAVSISQEAQNAAVTRFQTMLTKHMSIPDSVDDTLYYYGADIAALQADVDSAYSDARATGSKHYHEENYGVGYVSACSVSPQANSFSVRKTGVGIATVMASYNYTLEYAGNPLLFLPGWCYSINSINYTASDVLTPNKKMLSFSVQYELTMQKINGEWRIIYADSLNWNVTGASGSEDIGISSDDGFIVTEKEG